MASGIITVRWDGLDLVIKQLRAYRDRLKDLRPAWVSVLAYLRLTSIRQFRTQGARAGSPWKPLSTAYAKFKAKRWPGKPIMRASDRLFTSLAQKTRDSVVRPTRKYVEYGTRVPYARHHQRGGGRLPQRKVIDLMLEDKRQVRKIVADHLANQARMSGFEVI